jgi:hypothetical protein
VCKQTQVPGASFLSAILAVLGMLVAPLIASAQDATTPAQDGAAFSISPRLYSTFMDTGDYSEVTGIVMGGVSITAGPARGIWDLTVNALVGNGVGEWTALSEIVWRQTGHYEVQRTDVELVWHRRLPAGPVYLGLGGRFVNLEESYIGDRYGLLETDTTKLMFGEFHVGFLTPASKDGRHTLFGNFVGGVGTLDYRAVEAGEPDINAGGVAVLFDLNTGYQFGVNRHSSLSGRYRIIAVNTVSDQAAQHTFHGPEIAYTFKF